jgi:hypothetical protein
MSDDSIRATGRASLFVWQVSADQEEPLRRFLQELANRRVRVVCPEAFRWRGCGRFPGSREPRAGAARVGR